jgi:hypothetical protein
MAQPVGEGYEAAKDPAPRRDSYLRDRWLRPAKPRWRSLGGVDYELIGSPSTVTWVRCG